MRKLNLLKSALLLSLALLSGACSKEQPQKEIGLQLYSIREDIDKDLNASLDSVAGVGYSFVEAAGFDGKGFYGMDPLAFKELLESKGLQFRSSHIGIVAPDSAGWEEAMAWWDNAIAAHKAAGVQYIVQPFMGGDAFQDIAALQRYCDMFNAVGEKCKAAGIAFGYHNHDAEFHAIGDTVIYDYMMANTNPENVFFELDVYWATVGKQSPAEYLKKYPGRYKLLHIKDVKEIGASGTIDFQAIYEAAPHAGVEYCVVEQEDFDYPHFESIRKSFDFLNNAPYVKESYAPCNQRSCCSKECPEKPACEKACCEK